MELAVVEVLVEEVVGDVKVLKVRGWWLWGVEVVMKLVVMEGGVYRSWGGVDGDGACGGDGGGGGGGGGGVVVETEVVVVVGLWLWWMW